MITRWKELMTSKEAWTAATRGIKEAIANGLVTGLVTFAVAGWEAGLVAGALAALMTVGGRYVEGGVDAVKATRTPEVE